MKAILEFDMNEPDDIMAHNRATQSLDMALALQGIIGARQLMYSRVERAVKENKNLTPSDAVSMTFVAINDILDNYCIVMHKLIN
jgi:hypothetical protein